MFETVVRGASVVLEDSVVPADVAISDEQIVAVGKDLAAGRREFDARGMHMFPGVIDIHVHFNEPGRTHWEGAATGSAALAAGGGTLFFDMPLNSTPCTVNAVEFDRKAHALAQSSITDFALWGGLTPDSLEQMDELAERGVIGFKAFLCDSGLPEFPRADDGTLFRGLENAARLNLPVAVHAESHELTGAFARGSAVQGRTGIKDFLASRPVLAEVEAIQRSALIAGELRAKLHIVHASSGRGVAAAAEARAKGVDVSIETCPHYLFFTEEDMDRLAALGKCAPPLRASAHRDALWDAVSSAIVDHIGSDHSPAPPEMKSGDFWKAWGGIAGVQSTLSVLLDQGFHRRELQLPRIAQLLSGNAARRFRIANRGRIAPGCHADLTLVELNTEFTLLPEQLLQRHALSPYAGSRFRGKVHATIRRGETILLNGTPCASTRGKLVRPIQQPS